MKGLILIRLIFHERKKKTNGERDERAYFKQIGTCGTFVKKAFKHDYLKEWSIIATSPRCYIYVLIMILGNKRETRSDVIPMEFMIFFDFVIISAHG